MRNQNRKFKHVPTTYSFEINLVDPVDQTDYYVPVKVAYKFSIGNDSFSHEFGTEVYPDYIEEVYDSKLVNEADFSFMGLTFKKGELFPLAGVLEFIGPDCGINLHYATTIEHFTNILEDWLCDYLNEEGYPEEIHECDM